MSDALDQLLEDRQRLPERCPSWCNNQHAQALEEGCGLQEASMHYGPDYGVTASTSSHNAYTNVQLTAEHDPAFWKAPIIGLEAHLWIDGALRRTEVPLTTGEARVLARQLLHLADLADLD